MITELLQYKWPTEEWLVARLNVSLDAIASCNGLAVQSFVENGLGPGRACGGRLPSGVVVLLTEYEQSKSHFGFLGPALSADANDVFNLGIERLLNEALAELGLDSIAVECQNQRPTE